MEENLEYISKAHDQLHTNSNTTPSAECHNAKQFMQDIKQQIGHLVDPPQTYYEEVQPCFYENYLAVLSELGITGANNQGQMCDSGPTREKRPRTEKEKAPGKVITPEVLLKCITHPNVVKLMCDLLEEELQ